MHTTKTASTSIPAAEYLRMSTDDQQNSIPHQRDLIKRYAIAHGYEIVETYADEGRSGVAIKTRDALRRLLSDVVSGSPKFKAILVYDVSRWGRFQDLDEAAHYEFLCKSAGIPIRYCAEQFNNDGNMPGAIMKTLKRTMAAEFSRELSVKVFAAQKRIAQMGYRAGGVAGIGLRRMMVSPDGHNRLKLKDGERKAIKAYHTILVPGPKKEVRVVRNIFSLAANRRNTPRRIACELNRKQNWPWVGDRRWHESAILEILQNEKYIGSSIYGRTVGKLGGVRRRVPKENWIVVPKAFAPIVNPQLFDQVQRIINSRRPTHRKSDGYYLRGLQRVLKKNGRITQSLSTGPGICSHDTYSRRFGSILRAYELIGYTPSERAIKSAASCSARKTLIAHLRQELKELYPENLRFVHLPRQMHRYLIEFDRHIRLAIHICRQSEAGGGARWLFRSQPLERGLPCLICLTNKPNAAIISHYLTPPPPGNCSSIVLAENHEWLARGRKLKSLSELRVLATALAGEWQERDSTAAVGDVVTSARSSTITISRKEIVLRPVSAELFKLLVLNAGKAVSRARLSEVLSNRALRSGNLSTQIYLLRNRLGPKFGKRIQTVNGQGYMYEENTSAV